MKVVKFNYDLSEEDRKLILLSLALCSLLRPGFETATGEVAKKLGGEALWQSCRQYNSDVVKPTVWEGGASA